MSMYISIMLTSEVVFYIKKEPLGYLLVIINILD